MKMNILQSCRAVRRNTTKSFLENKNDLQKIMWNTKTLSRNFSALDMFSVAMDVDFDVYFDLEESSDDLIENELQFIQDLDVKKEFFRKEKKEVSEEMFQKVAEASISAADREKSNFALRNHAQTRCHVAVLRQIRVFEAQFEDFNHQDPVIERRPTLIRVGSDTSNLVSVNNFSRPELGLGVDVVAIKTKQLELATSLYNIMTREMSASLQPKLSLDYFTQKHDVEGGLMKRWRLRREMFSTENATTLESTKSRNSKSLVQIQIKPTSQSEYVPRDTEESEFLELVDCGGVAISVETVIWVNSLCAKETYDEESYMIQLSDFNHV